MPANGWWITGMNHTSAPGWLPRGTRVYAVGDVHGLDHRLADMHFAIAADLAERPIARSLLVHLGDYIDRGPDSRGALARLRACPLQALNLMGNHEAMALAALNLFATAEDSSLWLDNGGAATLRSYGADPADRATWSAIPAADRSLMAGLRPSLTLGGYFFAHAGIRPGVPLGGQSVTDLLWIREPFLDHRGPLPAVVVHGHTPVQAPELLEHRINLDTGAIYGGPLTCGVLEEDHIGFLFA